MIITKPFKTETTGPCKTDYHNVCSGKLEFDEETVICDCRCHYSTEREEPMSESTLEKSPMVRKPWSDTEVAFLQANAGKGAQLLAMELGRSTSQVRSKAMQLGLSLRQPGSNRGRRKTSSDNV